MISMKRISRMLRVRILWIFWKQKKLPARKGRGCSLFKVSSKETNRKGFLAL